MQNVSNNFNPMMYYGSPGEPMKYNGTMDNSNNHQITHVKTEKKCWNQHI